MRLLPSRRSTGPSDPAAPIVLRARSGGATMIAVIAAAALLLADAVYRGQWVVLFVSLPPLATIVWVVWILVYRPCIRYDDDAMEVVNVGRVTRMPWPLIVDLTMRFQVVALLADEKKVVSWGGPTMPRTKARRPGDPLAAAVRPPEMDLLLDAWHAHSGDTTRAAVTRHADAGALAIGAGLGVIVLIEAAVAAFLGTSTG